MAIRSVTNMVANVIVSLHGLVSEPVRCLIARRFALSIHSATVDEDAKKRFGEVGVPYFMEACDVQDGIPFVRDDLNVETTKLARFCNQWMAMRAFREPGTEEWLPITADMNSLRATMAAKLQALADETENCLDN